jgi:hypothetical protein
MTKIIKQTAECYRDTIAEMARLVIASRRANSLEALECSHAWHQLVTRERLISAGACYTRRCGEWVQCDMTGALS